MYPQWLIMKQTPQGWELLDTCEHFFALSVEDTETESVLLRVFWLQGGARLPLHYEVCPGEAILVNDTGVDVAPGVVKPSGVRWRNG